MRALCNCPGPRVKEHSFRNDTKTEVKIIFEYLLFSPVLVEILRAIGSPEEAMGNLAGLIYSCLKEHRRTVNTLDFLLSG